MADQEKIESPKQDHRLDDQYPGYGSNVMGTGSPGEKANAGLGPAFEGTSAPGGGSASEGGNTGEMSTREIPSSGPTGRGSAT